MARCRIVAPALLKTHLKAALLAVIAAASLATSQAADSPGQLKAVTYAGGTIAGITNGTARASAVEYVGAFEFADTGTANFARKVTGFFIPPANGNYVFYISSDDNSELWLSTDATEANKRLIAQENAWSAALSWTNSAGGSNLDQKRSDRWSPPGSTNDPYAGGIALTANQRYYIEGLHQEGGGGDNFGATFKRVGEADPASGTPSAITGTLIATTVPDTLPFLTQPLNRRVAPGTTVTLSALADSPSATYQWFRNDVAISDGTGTERTYTTPALTAADNGVTYHVVATDGAKTGTSADAVITVGQLVPVAKSLRREFWNDDTLTRLDVIDNLVPEPELVDTLATFETPTNIDQNYVQRVSGLFVAPVNGNYVFFVAADDTGDLFLSTDSTPANKRLIAQEVGWSGVRNWTGIGGTGQGLTDAQAIAQKRSDGFIPDPVGDPSAVPPFTNGIPLVAGTAYYIEAAHEEGGGGDNLAVTYKLVGQPDPVNGTAPRIDSSVIGDYPQALTLNGATITVTTQPTSTSGLQNRTVTLNVAATSGYIGDASGAGPALRYQWQTAPSGSTTFTNIPGATGTTFTTPSLALTDSGRQYRAVISGGDATVNSAAATVNVTPDTTAPRPVTVGTVSASRNQVTLSFNEVLNSASATTAANYVFTPGNITASSVTITDGTNLTITTSAPLTANVENTLTITGTQDLAGNPVAANTTIKFTFNPVTYEQNIRFDAPVAYYRFEETGGTVATNSGISGINGAYFEGDELVTGEGGTPREAVNIPGPRPGDFAGFAANNLAADFDGVDDWVDARAQYLQNVGAFTLEYWVNPRNRTNEVDGTTWPGRVALVGQNDAVEYGFITPGTIQIWTAGGGALDTPYRNPTNNVGYPDGEWHHVATIGDGTSIRTYFDGRQVGVTTQNTGNYGSSVYNVHIGGAGGFDVTGNWFTGGLDEVAIFNKAIPADRVLAHFRAGKEGGVITISGAVTPEEPGGGDRPTISVARTATTMTISWAPAGGTLQSTTSLTSPIAWQDVGAANPATIQTTGTAQFFRVQR
jgi:hypothetical protein